MTSNFGAVQNGRAGEYSPALHVLVYTTCTPGEYSPALRVTQWLIGHRSYTVGRGVLPSLASLVFHSAGEYSPAA